MFATPKPTQLWTGLGVERGPVAVDLTIAPDNESPVQRTSVLILCPDIPRHADEARNAATDAGAPVEVSLRLYNQGRVLGDDTGVMTTVRRTLAQGVGALLWSVRMIGVALAFLAPWIAVGVALTWVVLLLRRRKPRAPTAISAPKRESTQRDVLPRERGGEGE